MRLVLASTSPRRLDLLKRIGVTPDRVAAPDIDEAPHNAELPRAYVLRIAVAKASAIVRLENEIVLAGDGGLVIERFGRAFGRAFGVQPAGGVEA